MSEPKPADINMDTGVRESEQEKAEFKGYMEDAHKIVGGVHNLAEIFAVRSAEDTPERAKAFIADLKKSLIDLSEKYEVFVEGKEGFAPFDPQGERIPRRSVIDRIISELDDMVQKVDDKEMWQLDGKLYNRARDLYFYIGPGLYSHQEQKKYEEQRRQA